MTHRLTVTRGMNVAEDAGCSFPAAADRIAVSGGNIRIEALGNTIQLKLWMSEVNLGHVHQKNAHTSLQNPV